MAPLPKRRHSTRRGGKRWAAKIEQFKRSILNLDLLSNKNKHLRSITSNK